MYDANRCSGFCQYCNARIEDLISQGFNLNDLEKSLRDIDKKNAETIQFDFDALEKAIEQNPYFKSKSGSVTLWGADPMSACFTSLTELIDFIEYLNKEKGYDIHPGLCTNGLGFRIPEWVEYIIKHNIGISLSHDGLGQEIRTMKKEFDPLFFDGFDELVTAGRLHLISPVLNQYNSDPVANYRYFEDVVFSRYPNIQLRLSKAKNGKYDVRTKNINGLCNGKYYDELKGTEWGNMLIHNDLSNPILEHQLDIYIDGWKTIYDNPAKFKNCWQQAVKFARLNKGNKEKNPCYKFQNGILPYSHTIDTLGNNCECMLMDSQHHARFKEMAPYCKDCKYKGRYECKECNVMEPAEADKTALHQCPFNYRYQELMDYANAKIDLYEVMTYAKKKQDTNVRGNAGRWSQQRTNRQTKTCTNKTIQRNNQFPNP